MSGCPHEPTPLEVDHVPSALPFGIIRSLSNQLSDNYNAYSNNDGHNDKDRNGNSLLQNKRRKINVYYDDGNGNCDIL